jgi:cell division protein FtsB
MFSSKTVQLFAVLFLCTTIISSSIAVYYYYQFSESEKTIEVIRSQLDQRDQALESLSLEVSVIQQEVEDLRSEYKGLIQGLNASESDSGEINSTLEELKEEIDQFGITVDILIDYGNGTSQWFNGTEVQLGSTLFNATKRIANVEYNLFEMGVFIENINGVGEDTGGWWIWYHYDGEWQYGPVGSNQWILKDGDILSWRYN